jgi:hypothetical protein
MHRKTASFAWTGQFFCCADFISSRPFSTQLDAAHGTAAGTNREDYTVLHQNIE